MQRRDLIKSIISVSLANSLSMARATKSLVSSETASSIVPYHGVFRETPPLAVSPQGWIREMLERQVNGLASHHAASGYPFDTCMWTGVIPTGGNGHGQVWWPYEQTGYIIDGLERLGLLTRNESVSATAHTNIDYILAHPRPGGELGPGHIGPGNWPHAVVFRALLAEYSVTQNPTILQAMRRHYLAQPANYGQGRDVCNVEEMLTLYALTGDTAMLSKARQAYENFNAQKSATCLERLSDNAIITEHGVTFNETSKLPALLYLYTGDTAMLDATLNGYRKIDRDHMLADGLHSAEERTLGNSPDLYHETCDISDYTWSVGYLLMATGDATWGDHIEKTVFNAGLGAISKDFKAHQYYSSPNQVVAAEGIVTDFDVYRTAYRPGHTTECCSGNVHRFLPNYVLRQWMTTPQGGIVAALYGPSKFSTTIHRTPVSIDQETTYPFSETIRFTVRTPHPVAFPLHLRIPAWTLGPSLAINGKAWNGLCTPGTFETINRTFNNGDRIELHLPMPLRAHYWNDNGVSIERGPLVYSLKIKEDAKAVQGFKTTPNFPAWDIHPASPWNYGLALKSFDIAQQIKVLQRNVSGFPWDIDNSPVELQAPAMKIPTWTLPENTNPKLPENPQGSGQIETVTLVPYGSTRIRLTVFPLLSISPTKEKHS
jgi:hypothetical protein